MDMELGAGIRTRFAVRLLLGDIVRTCAALHEGVVVGSMAASKGK